MTLTPAADLPRGSISMDFTSPPPFPATSPQARNRCEDKCVYRGGRVICIRCTLPRKDTPRPKPSRNNKSESTSDAAADDDKKLPSNDVGPRANPRNFTQCERCGMVGCIPEDCWSNRSDTSSELGGSVETQKCNKCVDGKKCEDCLTYLEMKYGEDYSPSVILAEEEAASVEDRAVDDVSSAAAEAERGQEGVNLEFDFSCINPTKESPQPVKNPPAASSSSLRRSPRLLKGQSLSTSPNESPQPSQMGLSTKNSSATNPSTPRRSPRLSSPKRPATNHFSSPRPQKRRLFDDKTPRRKDPPTKAELYAAVDSLFSPALKQQKTVKQLTKQVENHLNVNLSAKMKRLVRDRAGQRMFMKKQVEEGRNPTKGALSGKKKTAGDQKISSSSVGNKKVSRFKELEQPPLDGAVQVPRVFCRKKPFHVDVSSMKSFYTEIEIEPPLDSYEDAILHKVKSEQYKGPWLVKMGDTVAIEVEAGSKAKSASQYPFRVEAWSPAEIVAIFQKHKSKDSCVRLRQSLEENNMNDTLKANDGDDANEIQLEVRWLYRMHEIPGVVGKASSVSSRKSSDLEEIFETDHLNYCSADSILSPIILHEDNLDKDRLELADGLPCIHYQCTRFWSLHRKSFITCGSLSSRAMRGLIYSSTFGKNGTASAALTRLKGYKSGDESLGLRRNRTWQEAFRSAIRTLSLAEAAHDIQLGGARLPCRDKERKDMSDFLKTAICGVTLCRDGIETSMAVKSSIFVAGPPGTGKTASLRSVIRELQEQQASGEVPEFKYIELNGMELRNPYDAYVKFWEAISGIKKEKLPPGQAAACLDKYFCEEADDYGAYIDEIDRRPVTVLLLDEIDYLVTEQETVLYSFFDWPQRAVPSARLIVIGIANILNLPDKLSPKLSSRMGQKRMFFPAYNTDEITTIIKKRLGIEVDGHDVRAKKQVNVMIGLGSSFSSLLKFTLKPTQDVFDIDAIRFAARKTANRSGDIRKAFQICKAAAERVYEASLDGLTRTEESRPIVGTQDVMKAANDMFSSVLTRAIASSTNFQACLLIAIGSLMKGGKEEARFTVNSIRRKMVSMADASGQEQYDGVTSLDNSTVLYMITRSAESGILNLTYPDDANDSFPRVGTHLSPYEICQAFKDTNHTALANKHLTETIDF